MNNTIFTNVKGEVIEVSKDQGATMVAKVAAFGKTYKVALSNVNGTFQNPSKGDLVYLNGEEDDLIATISDSHNRIEAKFGESKEADIRFGNAKNGTNLLFDAGGNIVGLVNGNWAIEITGDQNITVSGNVTIKASNVTIDSAETTITGNTTIDGSLTVNGGSVTHGGTNIGKTHKHQGDSGGVTGTPF